MVRSALRILLAVAALGLAYPPSALAETERLAAREAHEKAIAGVLVLIDVRYPREWRDTGVGASATPISMHLPAFLEKVAAATAGDKSRPLALICATGGRSSAMAVRLRAAGYTRVYDVAEGMLGSQYGEGWIRAGLPLTAYNPER
jgi:rhodanese-related sulfurtransferase